MRPGRFAIRAAGLAAIAVLAVQGCTQLLTHQEVGPHTPLMLAAAEGDLRTVKALLDRGEDINAQRQLVDRPGLRLSFHGAPYLPHGETALMLALERHHVEIVRLLLERGARTSLVRSESWRSTWESVRFDPFAQGDPTPDLRMLELLLQHADQPPPADDAYELLSRAAGSRDVGAVKTLVPIVAGLIRLDREKLALLYCRALPGIGPDDEGRTIATLEALHAVAGGVRAMPPQCAVQARTPGTLRYLLERGMDPNAMGNSGMRPLSWYLTGLERTPATHGTRSLPPERRELISLLLQHGADPRLADGPSPSAMERARHIASPELDRMFSAFGPAATSSGARQ